MQRFLNSRVYLSPVVSEIVVFRVEVVCSIASCSSLVLYLRKKVWHNSAAMVD